jgi:hypothetical protein
MHSASCSVAHSLTKISLSVEQAAELFPMFGCDAPSLSKQYCKYLIDTIGAE